MGVYLNPGNVDFQKSLNSEIYIDKTELIAYTNKKLNTEQGYICVSRPRRFGKSMAANMLTAYYSRGCDSREMFQGLKIAKHTGFEEHLNQYNVVHLNMQNFLSKTQTIEQMISLGVRGLWNFSHCDLAVEQAQVVTMHLDDSLMTLSYKLHNL